MIPQSRRPAFLLTRPEPQGSAFADLLRARLGPDLRLVSSPLLALQILRPELPTGDFAAVIFTSQAGVAAAQGLHGLPRRAYCVGNRTAAAAADAGFAAVSADGAADDLIALLLRQGAGGRHLHLRGRDSRGQIAARLNAAGVETAEAVIYAQTEQALTPEAVALIRGVDPVIAPLFSPRSAGIFARQWYGAGGRAPLFLPVLSDAIADSLPSDLNARIFVATHPQAEALAKASGAAFDAGLAP
ncbi:uroporphyrinogen-III synthase [Szabonella alba]|uniref:Uroporphyrinogen-III synthase n=1 Tax=Szabonella alba TaxID=2804194 RepID=A0A8K0VCJ5_9RHOB|nr:uroporphyrinogen-III synthase [Szabonella alba]MBL4916797.1 uroporphyrinogen-III synthase [Szabonella alba]